MWKNQYFLPFSAPLKGFTLAAMLCGFCIAAEYGACRPTSNAFFITHFSAKWLPYAWLISIPFNLALISLYNYLIPRWGALKVFTSFIFTVIGISLLCAAKIQIWPYLSFFHFVWKDVYILLIFKQLWSMIHATIPSSQAKSTYGLIFACGGIGSVVGSMFSGFLAVRIGSHFLFLFTLFFYVLLLSSYFFAYKRSGISQGQKDFIEKGEKKKVLSQILASKYLKVILLLVIFMQVSAAFVDYQFHSLLGQNITDLDLRTQYSARMISLINSISTCLQILTGVFLLPFLGIQLAHRLVPAFFGLNTLSLLFFPFLPVAAYSYVSLKAVDYSFFGMIREMLYSPLKLDEKFRVKAFIDVFAYRSSKALASLFILGFQSFAFFDPIWMASLSLLLIYTLWFIAARNLSWKETKVFS